MQWSILTNHDMLIYRPYFHVVNAEFTSHVIRPNSRSTDESAPSRRIISRRDPGSPRNGAIPHLDSPCPAEALRFGPGSPRRQKHLLQLDSCRADQGTRTEKPSPTSRRRHARSGCGSVRTETCLSQTEEPYSRILQ